MYKQEMKKLLLEGIIGFLIGISIFGSNVRGTDDIMLMYLGGFLFACIPHGWIVSGNILGMFAIGSFPIMIIYIMLRIVASFFVGIITYPYALISCLINMRREG